MKTSFGMPTCTYAIRLSREDLDHLLAHGYISIIPHKTPCTTSRLTYDGNKKDFELLDKKEIPNNLRFFLEDDVADIKGGDWHVQYLNIYIEGFKKGQKNEQSSEI